MRVVLVFVALITLGLIATVGCGESVPTPTPTPTLQETYLDSMQKWAFFVEIHLKERELYEQAAIDPTSVLEAVSIDPSDPSRPLWMTDFDYMVTTLDFLYLDPERHLAFRGLPVPSFERRADTIKHHLRTMMREYELWKADPYGNTDAFERLAQSHGYAFLSAGKLNLDAIKAMNTGEY